MSIKQIEADLLGDSADAGAISADERHPASLGYRKWRTAYDGGWNDALAGNHTTYDSGRAADDYKRGWDDGQRYKLQFVEGDHVGQTIPDEWLPSHSVIGANYNADPATVARVQDAIAKLAETRKDVAVLQQVTATSGVFDDATKAAVAYVNGSASGVSGSSDITDETLAKLGISPISEGSAAAPTSTPTKRKARKSPKHAAADSAIASARSPSDVQAAAKQVQDAAYGAPPSVKEAVDKAVAAAKTAKSPAEVSAAKEALKRASDEIAAPTSSLSWYEQPYYGYPAWKWLAGAAGTVVVLSVSILLLRRKRT